MNVKLIDQSEKHIVCFLKNTILLFNDFLEKFAEVLLEDCQLIL